MAWPQWIAELKARYLADAGNLFVLHGAVVGQHFDIDGTPHDCAGVLKRFLSPTRPVVGVLRPWPHPSRIEFAGIADRTRFENLVKANDLVEGRTDALRETTPAEALGRIWRALSTAGTDQAYLISDTERLVPGHRKRVDPIPGAPELFAWATDPTLTRSNNIVIFLTPDLTRIRAELVAAAVTVEVGLPAVEAPPEPPAVEAPTPPAPFVAPSDVPTIATASPTHLPEPLPNIGGDVRGDIGGDVGGDPTTQPLPDPIDPDPTTQPLPDPIDPTEAPTIRSVPPLGTGPQPPPRPRTEIDDLTVDEIQRDLESTLVRTLVEHPTTHRERRLPVMDAVAQVIALHRPDLWGTLAFSLDDEDQAKVDGAGGSAFLTAWGQDIALDAAAGMLLKSLEGDYTLQQPPPLDATAIRALAKRITRLLGRL